MSKFGDFIKTNGKIVCLSSLAIASAACMAYEIADFVQLVKDIKNRTNMADYASNDETIIDAEVVDKN